MLRTGERQLLQLKLQPSPQGNRGLYFVLAAVAIFTLLVGASVRIRRPSDSGDPALLLALRGVLRGVRVLLQRAPRPAGLGVLLVRRGGHAGPAATVPALRAGVPGTARRLGAVQDRQGPAAAGLCAGRRARSLAGPPRGARPRRGRLRVRCPRPARPPEMLYFAAGLIAGFAVDGPRASPHGLDSRRNGSCGGSSGARRSARCRSWWASMPCHSRSALDPLPNTECWPCPSASCRWPSRRRRPLPPDGRRGHRQAAASPTPLRSRRSPPSTPSS